MKWVIVLPTFSSCTWGKWGTGRSSESYKITQLGMFTAEIWTSEIVGSASLLPSWAWVSSPSALAGLSMLLLWDLLESRQEGWHMALRSAHHGHCSEFISYVWNSMWVLPSPKCHPFPYNLLVLSGLLHVQYYSHGLPCAPFPELPNAHTTQILHTGLEWHCGRRSHTSQAVFSIKGGLYKSWSSSLKFKISIETLSFQPQG